MLKGTLESALGGCARVHHQECSAAYLLAMGTGPLLTVQFFTSANGITTQFCCQSRVSVVVTWHHATTLAG